MAKLFAASDKTLRIFSYAIYVFMLHSADLHVITDWQFTIFKYGEVIVDFYHELHAFFYRTKSLLLQI